MTEIPITIKRYNLEDVLNGNNILFNTNNHWKDEKIPPPADYDAKLEQGNMINWIDLFHPRDSYTKIVLDESDLYWMLKAADSGMHTGEFSHIYDEELEYTCDKYKDQFPPGNWFIRTERVSLKYGRFGCRPYTNMKDIIISIVTSTNAHRCIKHGDTTCPIYFMKWLDLDHDKEFRIFVYNNNITAVSAQYLYNINKWLNTLSDEQIKKVISDIILYFNEHIKDKMTFMKDYVMDLVLLENNKPYFIEPNSFGKYYASGSSLFHWINDETKLYDNSVVELRYVSSNI
jgi:hypothetical protein